MNLIANYVRFGTACFTMKSDLETIHSGIENYYTTPRNLSGTASIKPSVEESLEPDTLSGGGGTDDSDPDTEASSFLKCKIRNKEYKIKLYTI